MDCITISDDEDIEMLHYVVNLEPIVIRIDDSEDEKEEKDEEDEKEEKGEDEKEEKDEDEKDEENEKESNHEEQNDKQPEVVETPQETKTCQQPQHEESLHKKCQPQDKPPRQTKPQMSDHELMLTLKNLGNQKYKNNIFDDAIRTYKRANELAKKLEDKEMSAILHFNLAMTYFRVGSLDQAADECAQAVKLNDKYMKAHLKRAEIYQRQRKFDEAVICYEHICELDSSNRDYATLLNHAKEAAKQTKKKDYYQILGLHSNFTREDLKKAYRQQALSHHPDRHSDADIVTRRIQEKHFKDASEAHSFIQVRLNGR